MIILSTILTTILARLNAKFDSNQILEGNYIYKWGHILRSLIRFVTISVIVILCVNQNWIDYVFVLLINFSVFWISFDVFINSDLNLPLFRIGETAWTDKQLRRISNGSPEMAFIFKIIIFFIFVFVYMEYLNSFA
jgi:hypothetical protein